MLDVTRSSEQAADVDSAAEPRVEAAATVLESPRLVTRGETVSPDANPAGAGAFLDWLGFSVRWAGWATLEAFAQTLETTFRVPREIWETTGRGWFGYASRINLGPYGLLAFGGAAQKGTLHVELNAHGCRRIEDWNAVRVWGETYSATVTRADLAHDDLLGLGVDVARALEWYREGRFNVNGRPPRAELVHDMDSGRGKTLYVGSRQSGKLLRVYEKGRQLGDPGSPWTRVEVELRNKGRVVPWEVVTEPGRYLAGSYPALAYLSAEQSRLRTTQRVASISYDVMVQNLRRAGGKSLNVMLKVHQGDAAGVLVQVVRDGVPGRLAGLEEVLGTVDPEGFGGAETGGACDGADR